MKIDIFVYGSLKKGCHNHYLLKSSDFVRKTRTREKYTMLDLNRFPGVLRDPGTSSIQGELYRIDSHTLERVDIFEGEWFSRQMIELECDEKAWMYFIDDRILGVTNR